MADKYYGHETDPRWTAMDEYAASHLFPGTAPHHKPLEDATSRAIAAGMPEISVSQLQGQFLALQCKFIDAKHALEVGTLGGYSTIWLASSSPQMKVVTVEVSPERAAVARESIDAAGVGERVEVVTGSGVDVLPKLREDILAGKKPKLDFTFIDADKNNSPFYYDQAVKMSRSGACVIVDNVVRRGSVAVAEFATDSVITGCRDVIENAAKDERVDATLIQTVGEKNYDGMLICRVK